MSKRTVKRYVDQQLAGKWEDYPALYVIDQEGNVIDGAHRNAMVATTRQPIWITELSGVKATVMHAIDIGRPRTLPQMLAIDGENAAPQLASALRFLKSARENWDFETFGFPISAYYELLEAEPLLREFAPKWLIKISLPKVPVGIFIVADYLIKTQAGVDAYEFLKDCAHGEALVQGDPAFAFREWVLNLPPKRNLEVTAQIGYTLIACWDKDRRGQQIDRLRKSNHLLEIAPLDPPVEVET